jgi:ABC-type xylose transport system substrate-binding protein
LTSLILVSVTLSLTNCAINSTSAGAGAQELRIGIIFPTSFMNYILDKTIADWNWTQERLIHYLLASGVKRDNIFTESADDVNAQIAAIDKLIDTQVDWIVLSGLGDERLSSFMGIPLPFLDYQNSGLNNSTSLSSSSLSDSAISIDNSDPLLEASPSPVDSPGDTSGDSPGDSSGDQTSNLQSAFTRAEAANIKIGLWGNGTEIDSLQFRVTLPNGFAIGQFQAEQLLKALEDPSATDASRSVKTGSSPWAVEILANTSQGLFTETYLEGVCSVLGPKFLDGTLTSRLADCQTEPISNWTNVDQTDLLDFRNQVKTALNPYLPNIFGVESIQLTAVLATTDQIAKEVTAVFSDASLIPNPQLQIPLIFGVGAMKLSIQNMVDSKQYSSVIYDNDQLAQTVAETIVDYTATETERIIQAELIEVTVDNLKTELIDPGYLSPGEAGL